MVPRLLRTPFLERIQDEKVLVLLGPRKAGKSTFLKLAADHFATPALWWNGDDADLRAALSNPNAGWLQSLAGNAKTLIIDEAQRIENIGLILKILHDNVPGLKIIATGSSAFDLANRINEPLTGRKWEFRLYPFSFAEMAGHTDLLSEQRLLNHRLVYGYYPEAVLNPGEEKERLKELANAYLYKDILTWERIQKPEKMERLVQALAFQVGHEVSYHELGKTTGLDNETVEKYVALLEKAFIVFRLPSLSRNLRNELKKSRKIYFYDNGLRNAAINQFAPMTLRQDTGQLQNFLMAERVKQLAYAHISANQYFWRTTAQQEVDYVEERDGLMQAFEFKWNPKARAVISSTFLNAYPGTKTAIIHPENAVQWLMTGL